MQTLGYEFDNDEFHAYVHGRLPYELLKPDPVLRNLLLSTPQQKIVRCPYNYIYTIKLIIKSLCMLINELITRWWVQIFTNADEAHVAQVLSRLGLEDCFQGVICFETLNPPHQQNSSVNTQILCKPSFEAMEAAIRIANVDPHKTVNKQLNNNVLIKPT